MVNVTINVHEALSDQSMSENFGCYFVSENFVLGCNDDIECEFDDFLGFEKRIEKFIGQLKI